MSKKTLAIGFVASALLTCGAHAAELVETTRTLATYPFSNPDPVPDTASRGFPYFRFDGSSVGARPETFRVFRLANDRLTLEVFPDVGGKVWGATERKTGVDFIYRNPVAKFRNIALRGPWASGGIEYNFGIVGHSPCTSTPVDTLARTNADGSVSVFVAMTELICRTTYQVEIRLKDGDDFFTTATTWFNAAALPTPYYHWMNGAFPVTPDMELHFDGAHAIGHGGDPHPWPVDEKGRRLSHYASNDFGPNKSYHVINGDNSRFGVWYPSRSVGFLHENESYDKYGRKIWLWALSRAGAIWEDLLTDGGGQYVELQSGRAFNQPEGATMRTPFKHPTFTPGRTDRFAEKWGFVRAEADLTRTNRPAARPRPVAPPPDFNWDGAYGHYILGQQAIAARDERTGETELRRALAQDPNFLPALTEAAFLALRRGKCARARDLAERGLSLDTYDAAANYASGLAHLRLGDAATARERLGLATLSADYRNAAGALLARIALGVGDWAEAGALAARVLAADGFNRDALLVRIVALRRAGRLAAARAAVRDALDRWPLFFAAMWEGARCGLDFGARAVPRCELPEEVALEIGAWYRLTGLADEARDAECRAGDSPLAKIRAGDYAAAARLPLPRLFPFRGEDIPALDAACAAHPDWKFKYYRAVLAAAFQDDATADRLLDAIGDAADEWSFFLYRARRRTGAPKFADLARAAALSNDARIGRDTAQALLAANRAEEARATVERALAKHPNDNALQILKARALNACGRWRETVEFLKGVTILPSEFGDNACDLWQEAWRALGDEKMAATYPENLGKGEPYPDAVRK